MNISELKQKIKDFLFPPKCVFCRRIIEEDGVCARCQRELPFRTNTEVFDDIRSVDEAYSCLYYEGNVRNALLRYKFGGLVGYADTFSDYLEKCINEKLAGRFDILSWVPLSPNRLKKRGYDQARLLAEGVCERLADGTKPVKTLRKCRNASPQSRQTTLAKRRSNILGAYEPMSVDISGKRIILIDDILTTGSTVSECARILKSAGAEKVYVVTIAKTRARKK